MFPVTSAELQLLFTKAAKYFALQEAVLKALQRTMNKRPPPFALAHLTLSSVSPKLFRESFTKL